MTETLRAQLSDPDDSQSPDGTRVAMSSEAGQLYIFDLAAEKLLSTYSSHAMAVRSFAWSYDSQVRGFLGKSFE